jgi:UDP-N-acetylglucosamine 1-carboxyvinyltransferase
MSIAIVAATQCDGVILMFEKMFESRMFFVDKLIAMGGRIVLCDPHRAIVAGRAGCAAHQ